MADAGRSISIHPLEKTAEAGQKVYAIAMAGYKEGSPWTNAQYEESVKQEHVHYFVAETKEEAVGFVGVGVAGTEAEIHSIAVSEKAKQTGIGCQLLTYAMAWLQDNNVDELFLEVRESNLPAIQLYKKAGFQTIGKRPRYYSFPIEDAYVMKKQVKQK